VLDGAILQRLDGALGAPHVRGNLEIRQAAKELAREDVLVLPRQVTERFTERWAIANHIRHVARAAISKVQVQCQ
jgi:hypothetical protein